MLKKISGILGLSFVLCCPSSFATTYLLTPGLNADFDFPPNSPQSLKNYFFWTINATCKLQTPDNSDDFYVRMTNNSARINGVKLNKNETMTIIVHNGDQFRISADSGAEVQLTNKGQNTIKASCST